ncbi:hypothetical protein [Planomonospora algeriensis]
MRTSGTAAGGRACGGGRGGRRRPAQPGCGGFAPVAGERVRIEETPFLTQVDVRADPRGEAAAGITAALGAPLPTRLGTYTEPVAGLPPCSVSWLGPDGEFQIFVRSSFAAYLWAWLLDAATEQLR